MGLDRGGLRSAWSDDARRSVEPCCPNHRSVSSRLFQVSRKPQGRPRIIALLADKAVFDVKWSYNVIFGGGTITIYGRRDCEKELKGFEERVRTLYEPLDYDVVVAYCDQPLDGRLMFGYW